MSRAKSESVQTASRPVCYNQSLGPVPGHHSASAWLREISQRSRPSGARLAWFGPLRMAGDCVYLEL